MVGPLRTGKSGFTHVLVAVDKFTKWIEAKPIKNLDACTAISFVRGLHSDMESRIASSLTMGQTLIRTSSELFAPLKAHESTTLQSLTPSRMDKRKEQTA